MAFVGILIFAAGALTGHLLTRFGQKSVEDIEQAAIERYEAQLASVEPLD